MPEGQPGVGFYQILNDAGEYLLNMREWSWAMSGKVNIAYENGKEYAWLPKDFRSLVHVDVTAGLVSGITLATAQQVSELRTSSIDSSTFRTWAFVGYADRPRAATGTVLFNDIPADGSTIVLDDGRNPPVTFEFDTTGDGVGTGNVDVDTSATGITTTQVADAFASAVNDQLLGTAPTVGTVDLTRLEMKATYASALVSLTNREPGTQGNVTITTSGTTNTTIVGMKGASDGGAPEPRLELWPTPASDDATALTCYYVRGWWHLDEDEHEIPIPRWLEGVYLELVRAYARGYEREDVAPIGPRLAALEAGPVMMAAIRRDSTMQGAYGRLRNGAAAMVVNPVRGYPFDFTGTSGPT